MMDTNTNIIFSSGVDIGRWHSLWIQKTCMDIMNIDCILHGG